jgi:acyl carrier protein
MSTVSYTLESILQDVIAIVVEMTGDWDMDYQEPMTGETMLIVDLGFRSLDVVQFVVAIQERYQRQDLPMEELLMADGQYVNDLSLGHVAEFLARHLG